jgi:hypothetical protein
MDGLRFYVDANHLGATVVDVPGNGSCMYLTIAHQMLIRYNEPVDDRALRQSCADFLERYASVPWGDVHAGHSTYADYILALADDPIAKEVKIADLEDNYFIGRVKYRSEHRLEDAHRLERYILSHRFLSGHLQSTEYIEAMKLVGSD